MGRSAFVQFSGSHLVVRYMDMYMCMYSGLCLLCVCVCVSVSPRPLRPMPALAGGQARASLAADHRLSDLTDERERSIYMAALQDSISCTDATWCPHAVPPSLLTPESHRCPCLAAL